MRKVPNRLTVLLYRSTNSQACTCVQVCIGVCVCAHLHRYVCRYACVQACVCCVYVHICIGTCVGGVSEHRCMCVHVCRHVCVCKCMCPLWDRFTSFTSLMTGRDVSFLLTNSMLCSLAPELRWPTSLKRAVLSGTLRFPH